MITFRGSAAGAECWAQDRRIYGLSSPVFFFLMEPPPARSRLLLIAAAVLFSTGGAAIKLAALTAWQVASFRSGVAALALLVALPEARRGWSARMAPAAAAYAATLLLFVLATKLTTAANTIFLQDTAPLYLLFLGPWLLQEPVRKRDLISVLALAAGMGLILTGGAAAAATAPDPARGNAFAAASGLTWALTVTSLRWLGRQPGDGGIAVVTIGNIFCFLAALPAALPVTGGDRLSLEVILYLGVAQIGLAYVLVTRALRHVTAFEATAILLLEPALNPLWTWLAHGERPTPGALAGGAIILLATLGGAWAQRRSPAQRKRMQIHPGCDRINSG
jgi:drug/metabolite transporter, DME family